MTARQLVYYPNKLLNTRSEVADLADPTLPQLIEDMKDTLVMHQAQGISAVQIGVLKRVIVVQREDGAHQVVINPVILDSSYAETKNIEGCLSFPGVRESISRYEDLVISCNDETGQDVQLALEGVEAVAVQHEIDHLNGILLIDYLKPLAKKMAIKKTLKTKKKLGLK